LIIPAGFLAVYFGFFSSHSSVFLLTIGSLVISRLITHLILIQFSAYLLTHHLKHGSNSINIGPVVVRVRSTPANYPISIALTVNLQPARRNCISRSNQIPLGWYTKRIWGPAGNPYGYGFCGSGHG
jgi:hypothetical protein